MIRLKLVPDQTNIPFLKWRKVAAVISIVAVLGSLVLAFVPGLNFGIDFRGGILIEIKTVSVPDLGAMRTELNGLGLGEVALQEFGAETDILIRVEQQPGGAPAQQAAVERIKTALGQMVGDDIDYRRTEFVGPKVSGELIEAGIIAVALAVVMMLVYIWFRFEWHFGLGAVVALVHDVAISIGLFGATQMEFNLATIAALLTIVGYSINDTVVVFDRVRENLRRYKTRPLLEVLNVSVNDTLARTTMTSVTTLLALFALLIFGGEVIRSFVVAMIWGIVIGTYSSVFVAAPLLVWLGLEKQRRREASEEAAEPAA
ncbi:MAG: protein translocase subunit SecF [Alphaproteobacteria bacterium]